MKKIFEHGAGFFKRMLSMLLIVVLLAGNLGVGSVPARPAAAGADPAPEEPVNEPVTYLAEGDSGAAGAGGTTIDFGSYGTGDLDIYNYHYYKAAENGATVEGSSGYVITGTNLGTPEGENPPIGKSIVIGNHPVDGDANTNVSDRDIPVSLKGLTMTGKMTIKPVGAANAQKVALTVSETSSLGELVVENDANLTLALNADLTVASITLGENSHLEVTGTGTLTVSGAFTSQGTVALNGGVIQADEGLSAATLSLKNTTVKAAAGKAITAAETLSMENGTVENASLFGYPAVEGETGTERKTLVLSGKNTFSSVAAVGCEETNAAQVLIEGLGTVNSSSGTNYYCDYSISYQSGGGAPLGVEDGWPVGYRLKSGVANWDSATILGYRTKASNALQNVSGGEITLPEISEAGSNFRGWKLSESEEPVKALTAANAKGDITLTADLKAGAVIVKLDRGYVPDQYSNDKDSDGNLPAQEWTQLSEVGGKVKLEDPFRFGYRFTGWKITSGKNQDFIADNSDWTEYDHTVKLDDCATDQNGYVLEDGQYLLTMEAQWELEQFGLTLYLGGHITDVEKIKISFDGENFQKVTELDIPGVNLNRANKIIKFDEKITYGQNISEFLHQYFQDMPVGTLPVLLDESTDGDRQAFAGWSNYTGAIDGKTTFRYGAGGMLAPGINLETQKPRTLVEYRKEVLQGTDQAVNASWGVMSYDLRLEDGLPGDWSLTYIDGEGKSHTLPAGTPKNTTVKVQQNTRVTLTTHAKAPLNISLWGFSRDKDGKKIFPEEQTYQDGDQFLTYVFEMPAANVTGTYGQPKWIDISKSPILFQENLRYNNRDCRGFWYADEIDGMTPLFKDDNKILSGTRKDGKTQLTAGTYFYQWDFDDKDHKLPVTSENTPTKNQLTLVNALKAGVLFKELNLVMRDAYVSGAKGSLIGGVDCEITNDGPIFADDIYKKTLSLADYANIIIDNTTRQSYTTDLYFQDGENTVGAIMPDTLRPNKNYQNELRLHGKESKEKDALRLGSAFGNFVHTVEKLTISEYTKEDDRVNKDAAAGADGAAAAEDDFKYLIHSTNWSCSVTDAVIEAGHKVVHVGNSSFTFTRSQVKLDSINAYSGATLSNSYLRVYDNLLLGYVPLKLQKNSRVVIDGNLEMNYQHWSSMGEITDGTQNWLVVKGNRCDLTNFKWTSGTLICNALIFGRCGGVSGGTVVTNQILSQPVGFWKYNDKSHSYNHAAENGQTEVATANEDDYPFLVWAQKREGIDLYSFTGGQTYLLGYYKTTQKTRGDKKIPYVAYDDTVTALEDNANPVKPFMEPLLDGNGDLVENPSVDTGAVKAAVEASAPTDKECVVLGNSTYNTGTRSRTIEISGSAVLYAAGNITFFNDTNVKGGTVYCNGTFGTKGDLTITGGSITAKTVGNAYNLTTTLDDGTLRWRLTDIQGGTIDADRIGAFEKYGEKDVEPKSTVTIKKTATIVDAPQIVHDVYINYILGSLFTNNGTPENPNTLRFNATWEQDKDFASQTWSNTETNFTPPNIVGGSTEEGLWKWEALTGPQVDTVTGAGMAACDGAELAENQKRAFDRIQMKLYAAKATYNLIFMEGAKEVTDVTCNNAPKAPPKADKDKVEVPTDKPIVLTFSDKSKVNDHTVLWYIDGSNIIHNVKTTRDENNGTISFTMPSADVEIYRTDELHLDLDIASYTLLQDGFWTETDEDGDKNREDSDFHYRGNLVIEQGSIENITHGDNGQTPATPRITVTKKNGSSAFDNNTSFTDGEKNYGTFHDIRVKADFDNRSNNRRVTLHHIDQLGESYSRGIFLEPTANINFTLDGVIKICRVHVPEGTDSEKTSFGLTGKTGPETDAFFPYVVGQDNSSNRTCLGNFYGAAGDITLENLTILGVKNGMGGKFCSGDKKNDMKAEGKNEVHLNRCVYNNEFWYSGSNFASNVAKVFIDECRFTVARANSWPSPFFEKCGEVEIVFDSEITITESGSSSATTLPFYYGIKDKLTIKGSEVSLSMRKPTTNNYQMSQAVKEIAPVVEVGEGATLTLDQHARLNKLVISGATTRGTAEGGVVNAGENGDGYLLCPDIEVNGGTLNAGGLIVSGLYDAEHAGTDPAKELQKQENFLSSMKDHQYILDGEKKPGLVVNGGTVNAKEYITGDVNGKVTVNGGTVNTPVLGVTGKLYGYTRYVPEEGQPYIYTYEKIPEKGMAMTVNITGGTVEIEDNVEEAENYLGGMYATVNISGGEVLLGENAVLGLTDPQKTLLLHDASANGQKPADFGTLNITGGKVESKEGGNGSIQMPYGRVTIEGETTGVKVHNMTADCGTIEISGVKGKIYENPYEVEDGKGQKVENVGVLVDGLLSTQNLIIKDGSVVYANEAYADVPENQTGTFKVEQGDGSLLIAPGGYGPIGLGRIDKDYEDEGADKDVVGAKAVNINYNLHPEGEEITDVFFDYDKGKEKNPNLIKGTGLPYYTFRSGASQAGTYQLQDATCSGYRFLGWYEYDPVQGKLGNRVTEIDKSQDLSQGNVDPEGRNVYYLGAKWEKVRVTFHVRIEIEKEEFNVDTMEKIGEGKDGKILYQFKFPIVGIEYGSNIFTSEGAQFVNFMTLTQDILDVSYKGGEPMGESKAVVTAEMADDYVNGGEKPLILMAGGTKATRTLITLDQNKNEKNRPKGTCFNLNPDGKVVIGGNERDRVSAELGNGGSLSQITAFVNTHNEEDGLIHSTAPGYTFEGWYGDEEATGSRITSDASYDRTTTLYAKWTPNTYLVRFSAKTGPNDTTFEGNQWVTAKSTEVPAVGAAAVPELDCCWLYDSAPKTDKNCFWPNPEGNAIPVYQNELPSAWREGYVFDKWVLLSTDGKVVKEITSENELNLDTFGEDYLDVAKNDNQEPVLTLYAQYHPVKVTYDLNEGKWMGQEPTEHPQYETPLAGYTKESEADSGNYEKKGVCTGADGKTRYYARSTTSAYFTEYGEYVEDDYRETLSRKGYTFQGWNKLTKTVTETGTTTTVEDENKYYGCAPRFEDLDLKAKWTPNEYNLRVHVKDDACDDYESAFSPDAPNTYRDIEGIKVGDKLQKGALPERKEWYAYNKDEEEKTEEEEKQRLLLGATFAALDPGDSRDTAPDSTYSHYAEAVINMLNSRTMFDDDDEERNTFFLPEDEAYKEDLAGAKLAKPLMSTVPDYPSGTMIHMYGVYRERSLVFIEEYADGEGTHSRIMYSHPWREYTNYPYTDYYGDEDGNYDELTKDRGYLLQGWYVGSSYIDPEREYPRDETVFWKKIDGWKDDNDISKDGYDINVYTAYLAHAEETLKLKASSDPKESNTALSTASHKVPGSMQAGALSYQIIKNTGKLKLVSKDEMKKHLYDSKWTEETADGKKIEHTADDTVAITLDLINTDGKTFKTVSLVEAEGKTRLDSQAIGSGWKLMLTLYHSRVMTKDKEFPFTIEYTFDKGAGENNQLEGQILTQKVTVELTPSLYDVVYQVNLPETAGGKKPAMPKDEKVQWTEGENTYSCTLKQGYGSALLAANQSPVLDGYSRETEWHYDYKYQDAEDEAKKFEVKAQLAKLALDDLFRSEDPTLDEVAKAAKVAELKNGTIKVYATYVLGDYTLEKDETVWEDAWTVTYGDAEPVEVPTGQKAQVQYGVIVTLKPETYKLPVVLTFTDKAGKVLETKKLEEYATKQNNGEYIFSMPAKNVRVSSMWDLYLGKGTIELYPEGFRQEKVYGPKIVNWTGNYRILQWEGDTADPVTPNVLKLYGDLTKQQETDTDKIIRLGNLDIESPNSIELMNKEHDDPEKYLKTTVTLTQAGSLEAKNILVPEKTRLTLEAEDASLRKPIVLTPDAGRAAIGALATDPVNGLINLKQVDVSMTLKAQSVSSGIGSGRQNSATETPYGAVTVTNSTITVTEEEKYSGAWIGGAGVTDVMMTGTTLGGEGKGNARALDGNTVHVTGGQIGAENKRIKAKIHAQNNLTIKKCRVYQ